MQLLLGSSWLPCLGIGVISAVFQNSGNVEAKREALTIDVIKKGSVINRLSLRHCIDDIRDLFTINIIKCKLLTSRKTFRSKSVFMKNKVVLFSQRFNFRIFSY